MAHVHATLVLVELERSAEHGRSAWEVGDDYSRRVHMDWSDARTRHMGGNSQSYAIHPLGQQPRRAVGLGSDCMGSGVANRRADGLYYLKRSNPNSLSNILKSQPVSAQP